MKFYEPKTKSGKPLLGVTINYNPQHNAHSFRWFINGEAAGVDKVASLLEYPHKVALQRAIKEYGISLVMLKGLEQCKARGGP